jgi:hypothetical protein
LVFFLLFFSFLLVAEMFASASKDENRPPAGKQTPRLAGLANLKGSLAEDLRGARWGKGGLWILATLWLVFLCLVFSILVPLHFTSITSWSGSVCEPNDAFNIYPGRYNPFAVEDFFQITVGFGEFSFSEAKMIDVAWDLVSSPHSNSDPDC